MKIEYIHFYVEDAKVWCHWFVNILGFKVANDYMLPPDLTSRTKQEFDTCTEVVKSGSVCFVLSSPLLPTSSIAEFLRYHPPGVADVAFTVKNIENILARALHHGAKVLQPLYEYENNGVYFKSTKIAAWGSLTHTLIEGVGSREWATSPTSYSLLRDMPQRGEPPHGSGSPTSLTSIDHIVLNVAAGELKHAVAWYEEILDFQPQQMFNIQTEYSALYSRVMISHDGRVQIPINEPATGNSQIQEFLDFNQGAGIQHIALRSLNLIETIFQYRNRNLQFLVVPQTYYLQLIDRPGFPLSPMEMNAIAQQEILVDWQENAPDGLLLQIFTQPIFGQPTFFFEFIERRNLARGFGEGNFRALFEAIEREQLKRGSLN